MVADDEQGSSQIVAGQCCDLYGRKRMYHYGMILLILSNTLSTFMPVRLLPISPYSTIADGQNVASLNVCRAFFGLGSSVAMPAAAGMIGTMFPPGRKRTYAFVAVSCGELTLDTGVTLTELI